MYLFGDFQYHLIQHSFSYIKKFIFFIFNINLIIHINTIENNYNTNTIY